MRKLRLYLDTSVLSHLFADDTPEKMGETVRMWDRIVSGGHEIFISYVTLDEMRRCPGDKRNKMFQKLGEIGYKIIEKSDEISRLGSAYIENKALPAKSQADSEHIACAVVANCDFIVSWNFRHLVNPKTDRGVRLVNAMKLYKEIAIVSPSNLAYLEDE